MICKLFSLEDNTKSIFVYKIEKKIFFDNYDVLLSTSKSQSAPHIEISKCPIPPLKLRNQKSNFNTFIKDRSVMNVFFLTYIQLVGRSSQCLLTSVITRNYLYTHIMYMKLIYYSQWTCPIKFHLHSFVMLKFWIYRVLVNTKFIMLLILNYWFISTSYNK